MSKLLMFSPEHSLGESSLAPPPPPTLRWTRTLVLPHCQPHQQQGLLCSRGSI